MSRSIKKITLKNFQSYKDQEILLKPGLNLLLGSSDSGKSAILRAISFVFYNNPRSKTLIHNGESETSVKIEFSDGTKVTRILGDRNAYEYVRPDGTSGSVDRIDKSIPDEIKKLLGNPPEDDFNGYISYADQFSKMFLVDLNPTDLPRSMSNLARIEILEETAKELMSSYKSIEKQTKIDEKKLKSLAEERSIYAHIDNYDLTMCEINKLTKEIIDTEEEIIALSEFISDVNLEINENCIIECNKLLLLIDKALSDLSFIIKESNDIESLSIFNIAIGNRNEEQIINSLEAIMNDINQAEKEFSAISDINKDLIGYISINDEYSFIKESGISLTNEYKIFQKELELAENDLKNYKQFLIDEKIACEACGSIIT
jgi:exonuclease SbcC